MRKAAALVSLQGVSNPNKAHKQEQDGGTVVPYGRTTADYLHGFRRSFNVKVGEFEFGQSVAVAAHGGGRQRRCTGGGCGRGTTAGGGQKERLNQCHTARNE